MIECLLQMQFFIIQTRKGPCSTHSPFRYYIMNQFTNHRKVLNVDLEYAYHFASCVKCNRHAVNHLNTVSAQLTLSAYTLTVKWGEKTLSKRHSSDDIMRILSDRDALEAALFDFDPAFFNNYDPDIGPTE